MTAIVVKSGYVTWHGLKDGGAIELRFIWYNLFYNSDYKKTTDVPPVFDNEPNYLKMLFVNTIYYYATVA